MFHPGDMKMDGTLHTNAYGNMPYNTQNIATYTESDTFISKDAFAAIYPVSCRIRTRPRTHITDVWVKDDTYTETTRLSLHQNATPGADIHIDTDRPPLDIRTDEAPGPADGYIFRVYNGAVSG